MFMFFLAFACFVEFVVCFRLSYCLLCLLVFAYLFFRACWHRSLVLLAFVYSPIGSACVSVSFVFLFVCLCQPLLLFAYCCCCCSLRSDCFYLILPSFLLASPCVVLLACVFICFH